MSSISKRSKEPMIMGHNGTQARSARSASEWLVGSHALKPNGGENLTCHGGEVKGTKGYRRKA
jgi:hypothetical protein